MKGIMIIFSALLVFAIAGCDSNDKQTQQTVINADTVSVEKEYKIEKTIKEKTVEVDTIKETETVTTQEEYQSEGETETVNKDENETEGNRF